MNVFSKVTVQSLKKNRTRTIVTIIGIILSTALICAVTTSIASVQKYAVSYYEYVDGKWHGLVSESDVDTYNKIKSSDKVAGTGSLSYIGYAEIGSINEYKPYLYICGFEENIDGLIPVHLKSGRMPQNRTEIIIPDHLDENGERIRKPDGSFEFDAVPLTDWGTPEKLEYWREKWAGANYICRMGKHYYTKTINWEIWSSEKSWIHPFLLRNKSSKK